MTPHLFRTEVVVLLSYDINAASSEGAEREARQIATHQDVITDDMVADVTAVPVRCGQGCPICLPKADGAATLNSDELAQWLRAEAVALGTDNQRERWHEGLLPDEELAQIARAELFKPFGAFPKRVKMRNHLLLHSPTCAASDRFNRSAKDAGGVSWSTHDRYSAEGLTDEEWISHKRIAEAAVAARMHPWMVRSGGKIRLLAREHAGECTFCHAAVTEHSVLVEIDWGKRVLSREYSL